jgi:hypothetical protein
MMTYLPITGGDMDHNDAMDHGATDTGATGPRQEHES